MTTSAGFLFSFSDRDPPNSCLGCHHSQREVAERGQRSSQRSESVFTSPTSSHVVSSPLAMPTVPQATGFLFSLFGLHQGKKDTVVQVNRDTWAVGPTCFLQRFPTWVLYHLHSYCEGYLCLSPRAFLGARGTNQPAFRLLTSLLWLRIQPDILINSASVHCLKHPE